MQAQKTAPAQTTEKVPLVEFDLNLTRTLVPLKDMSESHLSVSYTHLTLPTKA